MIPLTCSPGYSITKEGRVWSHRSSKFLKPRPLPTGYLRVSLPTRRDTYIHRLVGETFLIKTKGKDFINHKNGDKSDNRTENLEWVTCQENSKHRIDVLKQGYGDKHCFAKVTNTQVREIKKRLATGEKPTAIARSYPLSRKAICNIKHGRAWRGVK